MLTLKIHSTTYDRDQNSLYDEEIHEKYDCFYKCSLVFLNSNF